MSDNPVCKSCAYLRVTEIKPYCTQSLRDEWGTFECNSCVFDSNQKQLVSLFKPASEDTHLYEIREQLLEAKKVRSKLEKEIAVLKATIQIIK